MKNNNCDGDGPCLAGTVKVIPYSKDGNIILCFACFNREMVWRRGRNKELGKDNQFEVLQWKDAKTYAPE